jgi:hypothetical protein
MKYLLIQSSDWADEFTCEKFAVYDSREEAENTIQELIQYGGYFGTNEGWEEGELSDYDFKIVEVTEQFVQSISDVFGKTEFGTGLV